MIKPKLVGITGGIGAGKSVIARIFRILGVPVYNADARAKHLMVESQSLRSAVTVLFGDESYTESELNTAHIASKAFYEPKLLTQLNGLVHPAVQQDFAEWLKTKNEEPYVMKEAALLIETGTHKSMDKIILVTASDKIRKQRVLERDDHRSEQDVLAIMGKQMNDSEKERVADIVLKNDGSELVIPQVLELHAQLVSRSGD